MTDNAAVAGPAGGVGRRWLVVGALIVALVGGGFLIHEFGKPAPKATASTAVPVSTAQVTLGSIDVFLDALGTVTPVYTVTLASRVAGELTEIHYKEGQLVKKNDLMAVIDPRPYRAALVQAQGQLERDQASLKNARLDLTRYENSFKERAISQQQLATQQALVEQDQGTVKIDEGNLAASQVNVDYTRIVSPIDGRVGLRTVDPGNIVPANGTTGLLTIAQLQPITVIFTVAEDDLGDVTQQLATGRKMAVQALDRAKTHKLADGMLITVDNQVSTATGTVRARAQFANTHYELFPNQFVNARLLVRTLTQVPLAPQAAIQRDNDTAFVYVLQPDGMVKAVDIKILATEGGTSAVSGIKPGEQIVTDGFDKLQSGTKVAVRAPSQNSDTATADADGNADAGSTRMDAVANGDARQNE